VEWISEIPNYSQNLTKGSDLNGEALSVTILLGQSNLAMMSSRKLMITL
jgi:hypothetical protein